MNNSDELKDLRSQILEELVPLAEQSDFDPEQKFNLILASAKLSSDTAKFRKAHQAAQSISDVNVRANALLDLLEAVDEAVGSITYEDNPVPPQDTQPQEFSQQQ